MLYPKCVITNVYKCVYVLLRVSGVASLTHVLFPLNPVWPRQTRLNSNWFQRTRRRRKPDGRATEGFCIEGRPQRGGIYI